MNLKIKIKNNKDVVKKINKKKRKLKNREKMKKSIYKNK